MNLSKYTEIFKENGVYSFTRLLATVGYVTFIIGSFYLMYKGVTWGNYETFAIMTGGGGAVTQMVNKFINSKFNTGAGQVGKPLKDDEVK